MNTKGSLELDVKVGEKIVIGESLVEVQLVSKSGKKARIKFVASKDVKIKLLKNTYQ